MVVAVVILLLILGSLLFHFLSPWYFTPLASNCARMRLRYDSAWRLTRSESSWARSKSSSR